MSGWIKIHRSIQEWEWFGVPQMLEFWVRLLLLAEWEGPDRGTVTMSLTDLAKMMRCSVKQIRTFLSRLERTGEIKIGRARCEARMGTRIRTRITICNYDSYQSQGQDVGQEVGHDVGQPPLIPPDGSLPHPHSLSPLISPQDIQEGKEKDVSNDTHGRRTDYDAILKLWNDTMTGKVPKVKALSQARKDKVRLRVEEMGKDYLDALRTCFEKVNASSFCNGKGEKKWVASFDWFFSNSRNWLKVFEGNYDDKQTSRIEQYADTSRRFNNLLDEIYGTGNTRTADGIADTADEQ